MYCREAKEGDIDVCNGLGDDVIKDEEDEDSNDNKLNEEHDDDDGEEENRAQSY